MRIIISSALLMSLALTGIGCTQKTPPPESTSQNTGSEVIARPLEDGVYTASIEKSSIIWSGKKAISPPHTGTVQVAAADLVVEQAQPTAGNIAINMQSITSDEDLTLLVEHLKNEDFFAAEMYPTATFAITNIAVISPDEINTNYVVTGNLKIREIEKTQSFPLTISQQEDHILVKGTIVVNRADFDIRYNSSSFFENLGDKLIEDNFTLTLDLVFEKL